MGKTERCPYWDVCVTPSWYQGTQGDFIARVCVTEKYRTCLTFGSLKSHFTEYLPTFYSARQVTAEFKRTAVYMRLKAKQMEERNVITPVTVEGGIEKEMRKIVLNDPPKQGWESVGPLIFSIEVYGVVAILNKSVTERDGIYEALVPTAARTCSIHGTALYRDYAILTHLTGIEPQCCHCAGPKWYIFLHFVGTGCEICGKDFEFYKLHVCTGGCDRLVCPSCSTWTRAPSMECVCVECHPP